LTVFTRAVRYRSGTPRGRSAHASRRLLRLSSCALAISFAISTFMAAPANAAPLFSDGFETGNMGNWNKSIGITVQQTEVKSGAWAARATSVSTSSWAWKSLGGTRTELFLRAWVKVLSHSTSHILLRFRTDSGSIIASVGVNASDRVYRRNDVSGTTTTSTTVLSRGVWHDLQMRVLVNGTASQTGVWLDGSQIASLSGTTSLGTSPIGRVQIGDNAGTRTSDTVFDDVVADTVFIGGAGDTTPPSTPTGLSAAAPVSNRVDLSWNRSPETDVAGYTVYRNGTPLAPVNGATTTTYSDTTVSPSTTYSYSVDAFDTAQNHSPPSGSVSVTTPSGGGSSDPVIAAAGDIACDPASTSFNGGNGTASKCHMKQTAAILQNLLSTTNLQAILPVGDTQYDCGGLQAFNQSYALSWGQSQLKSISRPVVGDQEYTATGTDCAANAAGYFTYFGSAAGDPAKGYYSFDVGTWHVVALNSECTQVGGCGPGTPQYQFLQADLAAHPTTCTLAYWHKPRFASSQGAGSPSTGPFWDLLYAAGAEIVLGGHHHVYERFDPQTPSQQASANGIRSFTVGTGGKSLGQFFTIQPNSVVRENTTYGVLKLTLHPTGYDWQFVGEAGSTFTDAGTATCH
jgi:acid phosphatase type 7